MPESSGFLLNAFIYLWAAVLAVPGSKYLGLGPVPGYLFAGFVVGPWGLAFIRDSADIDNFTGFGVIVLLFLIGLGLKPALLLRVRSALWRYGGLQLLLCTVLMFVVAALLSSPWREAFVVAMALSLSSSAIPLYYLQRRNLMSTDVGFFSLSILLCQQIAVVPMLLVIPLLSLGVPADGIAGWLGLSKAIIAIAIILIVGRYLLRHAYRYIANSWLPEVFSAFSLLLITGTLLLMHSLGLPMALGAFLCGVLMADSEYHREVENTIEPFKGLLLGLFFMSVGMGVDFSLLFRRPSEILGLLLTLLLIKTAVTWLIARRAGIVGAERWQQSLLLAQSGELTFLLLMVAANYQAIPDKLSAVLTVVVALSMLSTPLLLMLQRRYGKHDEDARESASNTPAINSDLPLASSAATIESTATGATVIVAGFGRVGQIVTRLLYSDGIHVAVIDHDPAHMEQIRAFGFEVYYGDALRMELLRSAGAEQASVLVVCIDDEQQTLTLVQRAKQAFPHLDIVARARDMPHYWQLAEEGVSHIHRETLAAAVLMGEDAVSLLGREADEVERISEAFLDHEDRVLQELQSIDAEKKHLGHARNRRGELALLLGSDLAQRELERRVQRGEEEHG